MENSLPDALSDQHNTEKPKENIEKETFIETVMKPLYHASCEKPDKPELIADFDEANFHISFESEYYRSEIIKYLDQGFWATQELTESQNKVAVLVRKKIIEDCMHGGNLLAVLLEEYCSLLRALVLAFDNDYNRDYETKIQLAQYLGEHILTGNFEQHLFDNTRAVALVSYCVPEASDIIEKKAVEVLKNDLSNGVLRRIHLHFNFFKSIFRWRGVKAFLSEYCREKFDIDFAKLSETWKQSGNDYPWNLEKMHELEDVLPGSVKQLFEEYGIREFRRYPKQALLAQIRNKESQIPYGILIYPHEDWNDAFDNMTKLWRMYNDLEGHYALRIFESGSLIDLAKILIKLNRKYGKQHKISFLVLGGHGTESAIQLGDVLRDGDRAQVLRDNFEGEGVKRSKDFFVEHPTIILESCSTGKEEGIGEVISRELGAEVIAPKIPAGAGSIQVTYHKDGRPNFNVIYSKKEAGQKFASGILQKQ